MAAAISSIRLQADGEQARQLLSLEENAAPPLCLGFGRLQPDPLAGLFGKAQSATTHMAHAGLL